MLTPVWQSPGFAQFATLGHGFFGRQGGVSKGVYASLNCALHTQDDADAVAENRRRVQNALGASMLITPYQTHSARVYWVTDSSTTSPKADALLTTTSDLAIGVLSADCVPILLCDTRATLIGAVHAGWRGAAGELLDNVIANITEKNIAPDAIHAAIGPAISQNAYEVGDDMYQAFCSAKPQGATFFRNTSNGKYLFDLPGFIARELARLGLTRITASTACTYQTPQQLFSYRYNTQQGDTHQGDTHQGGTQQKGIQYGRQVSAICLQSRKTIAQAA